MTVAHMGMAILIAGVSGSSAWKQENILTMVAGESVEVAGFTVTFNGAELVQGPNYESLQGTFTARKGNSTVTLTPERRVYDQPVQQTTEAAIHTTFWSDLYLVIGDGPGDREQFVVRAFFEPFVPFLWYGILLMGFGGCISLTDRRHRIGAPKRATASAHPAEVEA